VGGALLDLALRTGRGDLGGRIGRLTRLPRADWGKMTAHTGLGVTFIGVAGILAWQVEDIRVAQLNEPYTVGAYTITLQDVRQERGPNYVTTIADLQVQRGTRAPYVLTPESRFYPVANMPTTEAAIKNGFLQDVYAVIGEPQPNGGYTVRVYIKPLANWIWGGSILMALGGLISLTDRRLRVAAGAAKPKPAPVPAE